MGNLDERRRRRSLLAQTLGFGVTLISGEIALDLPPGAYLAMAFDPKTGVYSPGVQVAGGAECRLAVAEFTHDTVIGIRRVI